MNTVKNGKSTRSTKTVVYDESKIETFYIIKSGTNQSTLSRAYHNGDRSYYETNGWIYKELNNTEVLMERIKSSGFCGIIHKFSNWLKNKHFYLNDEYNNKSFVLIKDKDSNHNYRVSLPYFRNVLLDDSSSYIVYYTIVFANSKGYKARQDIHFVSSSYRQDTSVKNIENIIPKEFIDNKDKIELGKHYKCDEKMYKQLKTLFEGKFIN